MTGLEIGNHFIAHPETFLQTIYANSRRLKKRISQIYTADIDSNKSFWATT